MSFGPLAAELGAEFVPFEKLVETCDVVVLACPANAETRGLFNANVFKKMKPTSVVVNVGRGGEYGVLLFILMIGFTQHVLFHCVNFETHRVH